jgi:hypothetical protein
LPPDVILNQLALLLANQLQPPEAETAKFPLPPDAPNDWLVGEME